MNIYSVTVEYEDEREGQWVRTVAVLASDVRSAKAFALAHVTDLFWVNPATVKVTASGQPWQGTLPPRVVATLTERNGKPFWATT